MDSNKIGRFILQLRKEKNLSQYQLADMIPISRQAVSKWERGETIPDSSTLLCLSRIFNVTINELLTGERNPKEDLQTTTLNILDESNKKTKSLKRTIKISVTIVTILLLSFLSYYFISSYNTTEIYTISGDSNMFNTKAGILIKTKERLYIKLSTLRSNKDVEIKNISYCYLKNNKEKLIMENQEIDNIIVLEHYGYNESGLMKDINDIKDNSYLKITYNDDQFEILKLKYTSDFKNNSLFFKKKKIYRTTDPKNENKIQETIKEEDTKPEENKLEEKPKEETKQEEKQQTAKSNEEPKSEIKPSTVEEPKLEVKKVDINAFINKIKTNGIQDMDSYIDETTVDNNDILMIYYETLYTVTIYKDDKHLADYITNTNTYNCIGANNCEDEIKNIFNSYLQ